MILDLRCVDTRSWTIVDGSGSCPDCSALVAANSISEHARWHQQLVCELLSLCASQERLNELTVEFHAEDPDSCVRLIHQLQIERLGLGHP